MPYIVSLIILHDINCYLKVPVDKYMNILRNLYQTDTFTRRALWLVPKGVHIKKFYCNIVFFFQISVAQASFMIFVSVTCLKYQISSKIFSNKMARSFVLDEGGK